MSEGKMLSFKEICDEQRKVIDKEAYDFINREAMLTPNMSRGTLQLKFVMDCISKLSARLLIIESQLHFQKENDIIKK